VDEGADATWLVLMLIGALICGGLVLLFKPDYRFSSIIESNQGYYPAVPVNPPGESTSNSPPFPGMS